VTVKDYAERLRAFLRFAKRWQIPVPDGISPPRVLMVQSVTWAVTRTSDFAPWSGLVTVLNAAAFPLYSISRLM